MMPSTAPVSVPYPAMPDPSGILANGFLAGFRPEPELTVAEWADTYRIVGKPSPKPGPWRTELVPYTRAIMEDLSPTSPVEFVVLMKAAQGAGSETGLNALGCWMHKYPDSGMIVLPTINTAKKFVRTRFDKFVAVNPSLSPLVLPPRHRDGSNTTSLKELVTGDSIIICGANSASDLRSYPSRYLIMDEVDGYPVDVDGEGDPTDLAIQRTAAYRGRKIFIISTPTDEETSLVLRWYRRGDQRVFKIPCPFCSHPQQLRFVTEADVDRPGGLRWPAGRPSSAAYECEQCVRRWEEWRKVSLLQEGFWEPLHPGIGDGKIHSYQISALYYPYGWPEHSWANLAETWEADRANPIKRKTFVNLRHGLPYKDQQAMETEADDLVGRRESYGPAVPAAVAVVVAGVDVQANRIECEFVGFGRDAENWSLGHFVLLGDTSRVRSGDPAHPSPWEELDRLLRIQLTSETGMTLTVAATCVDAGNQTQTVADWCRPRFNRRIWAILGRSGTRPIWSKKPGRVKASGAPVFSIGVDAAKSLIYEGLRIKTPGPRYSHFPTDRDYAWFEQLTAEKRVPDYTGSVPRFVWRKRVAGIRNEALDCRVYAEAALAGLQAGSLRLNAEVSRRERMLEAKLSEGGNGAPLPVRGRVAGAPPNKPNGLGSPDGAGNSTTFSVSPAGRAQPLDPTASPIATPPESKLARRLSGVGTVVGKFTRR